MTIADRLAAIVADYDPYDPQPVDIDAIADAAAILRAIGDTGIDGQLAVWILTKETELAAAQDALDEITAERDRIVEIDRARQARVATLLQHLQEVRAENSALKAAHTKDVETLNETIDVWQQRAVEAEDRTIRDKITNPGEKRRIAESLEAIRLHAIRINEVIEGQP